jgi:hypothetical protein
MLKILSTATGISLANTLDLAGAEAALATGDVGAVGRELSFLFPDDPDVERLDDLVRLAFGRPAPDIELSPAATLFYDSMARSRRLIGSRQSVPLRESRMLIGKNFDFVGSKEGMEGWTIPQCLNFLLMGQIRPTRRAAVVGTMRDDGIYVLEWIAYYLALGFEHIFIYTNDNADRSEELLRLLAGHKVITLIESETSGKVAPEAKAYEHSIHFLHELREFEWVLYVDSDEYFVPAPRFQNSILNVLAAVKERFPGHEPSAVCYPWLWFISEMAYLRTPGFLIERFQHARFHWITKALVRLQDAVSMRHEHFPDVKSGCFLVDSAFETLPFDVRKTWNDHNPQYSGGQINHYWPKSFEEFAIKKARGQALQLEKNLYDRPFELFFSWNGYASKTNYYPIDPVVLERVRQNVRKMKDLEAVRAVADRIDREFPALLDKYYGGRDDLRSLYWRHKRRPAGL